MSQTGARIITFAGTPGGRRLLLAVKVFFYCAALVSLTYAVVTAPAEGNADDLITFQTMGQTWVDGVYNADVLPGPPPYLSVLLAPLSLLPLPHLKIAWLALNLATAAAALLLTIKLVGEDWPVEARYFLASFFLAWAPFRVVIRYGQISLIITALVVGALLAAKRKKDVLAGVLLGLALCKYPLSFAFLLYFAFRKRWKVAAVAPLVPAALTLVFALRLGVSPVQVVVDYVHLMSDMFASEHVAFIGVTEVKPLLYTLAGGNESVASALTIILSAAGLASMFIAFKRRPQSEALHYAILTFFTMWSLYHRVYDSVLCVIPAAVLIDFLVRRNYVTFGVAGLAALGLLVLSVPGLLTIRLGISSEDLSASPLHLVGLHIERLLMIGMFCAFMVLLWRRSDAERDLELAGPPTGRTARRAWPLNE